MSVTAYAIYRGEETTNKEAQEMEKDRYGEQSLGRTT